MADQLSLRINLSSAQAADKLRAFNALLGAGDKSMASFNKALNGMATASNVATSDVKKTGAEVDNLGKKSKGASTAMTALGKGAGAFGTSFARSLKGAISGTVQLTKGILAIGAAMAGIGGIKLLSDYIDYSKSAGQLNAIVKGNGSTERYLENMGIKATAGTGQNAADVMGSMQNVASTLEFDPTRGKKLPGGGYEQLKAGSAGYMANLKQIGDLTERNAEFSSSMNTNIGTMTDAMIKYAGVFGYDMKDMNDVIKIQDKFNALLNTSQGGLERLVPQIAKFGQQYKMLGMDENDALAVFSTLTNVFDPEEAGTRTLAVGNWIERSVQKIGPMTEKMGKEVGDKFKNALYDAQGNRRKMKDQILGVMGIMDQLPTQYQQDIFGGQTFAEIRQASGIKTMSALMDKYDQTVKEIADDTGLSSKSIDAYWAASGAKLDLLFKSMQAGAMSGVGAIIDIFSNLGDPSKFNIKDFTDGIGELGAKLNYRLGDGASAPLAALRDGVLWLNDNRKIVKDFAESMGKLAQAVGAIGKFALDIVISPPVQALLDFVISNPVISIATIFSVQALTAALGAALTSAFGALSFSSGLALAMGDAAAGTAASFGSALAIALGSGVVIAAMGAAIIAGFAMKADEDKRQQEADKKKGEAQAEVNKLTSETDTLATGRKNPNTGPGPRAKFDPNDKDLLALAALGNKVVTKEGDVKASKAVLEQNLDSPFTKFAQTIQWAIPSNIFGGSNQGKIEGELATDYNTKLVELEKAKNDYKELYNKLNGDQKGAVNAFVPEGARSIVETKGGVDQLGMMVGQIIAGFSGGNESQQKSIIDNVSNSVSAAMASLSAAAAKIQTPPNVTVPVYVTATAGISISAISGGPTTNSAGNKAGGWVQNAAAQAQKFINKAQGKS